LEIAWGLWKREKGGNVRNIMKFFSNNIINDEGQSIISQAQGGLP
jgi:hypothetical protein